MTKTATISIDSIKDSDGWYELAHELGLEKQASQNRCYAQCFLGSQFVKLKNKIKWD